MNNVTCDLTVHLNGGLLGGSSQGLDADVRFVGADIKFATSFCSKHPKSAFNSYSNRSNRDPFSCDACFNEIRDIVNQMYQSDDSCSDFGKIGCENIRHTHECKCHLGHDCVNDDQCHVNQQRMKDGQGDDEPHALYQLAAEAPSDTMSAVYDRIAALEADNAALKNLVTKILSQLPEDDVNPAAEAAIREKLGLNGTPRSAESFNYPPGDGVSTQNWAPSS